jgi:hypothetical protein
MSEDEIKQALTAHKDSFKEIPGYMGFGLSIKPEPEVPYAVSIYVRDKENPELNKYKNSQVTLTVGTESLTLPYRFRSMGNIRPT